MYNLKEITVQRKERGGRERSIAVAIDKDKTSQYALKWALDNIVKKDETMKLVHVIRDKSATPSQYQSTLQKDEPLLDKQNDSSLTELFLPFRCFCRRRLVQCENCILEDPDISKALIEYVCQQRIGILFLGSTTRNSLSRLFRGTDISSNVLKYAADFCTVYVISSKGKIHTVKTASRPVPPLPSTSRLSTPPPENEKWYDEISAVDMENSGGNSSGRLSTESNFQIFYENLGNNEVGPNNNISPRFEFGSNNDDISPRFLDSALPPHNHLYKAISPSMPSIHIMEGYEDEMERLKNELKQTLELYHEACKEAKQKAAEVEEWKRKEEKRLLDEANANTNTNENTAGERTAATEPEPTEAEVAGEKKKVTIGAVDVVQKLVEIEVQNRLKLEMKALRENEEALGQSQIVLKYQSLFHMVAVLFLFYFYFSIFR